MFGGNGHGERNTNDVLYNRGIDYRQEKMEKETRNGTSRKLNSYSTPTSPPAFTILPHSHPAIINLRPATPNIEQHSDEEYLEIPQFRPKDKRETLCCTIIHIRS